MQQHLARALELPYACTPSLADMLPLQLITPEALHEASGTAVDATALSIYSRALDGAHDSPMICLPHSVPQVEPHYSVCCL